MSRTARSSPRKPNARADATYDVKGRVVMAGAIDPHTHIGGGKMTIARMLLPEDHQGDPVTRTELTRAGSGRAVPSTHVTGYRYAEMGYTACFEPAMLPANARQAHMEMGDTPMVDKGAFAMLGSDDFFLRQLAAKNDFEAHQGLRRLDHACRAGHRRQGGQSGRHQRLQVQSAQARSRRGACLLPRDAAADHPDARPRVERARRHPPAARPWLQSRHPRQYRIDARHDPRRRRPAHPYDAYPVPELRHGRATANSPRARRASPSSSTRPRMSRSTSARCCSARPARPRATACANTPSPRARIPRSR